MAACPACGEDRTLYECPECGNDYCGNCRVPKRHDCGADSEETATSEDRSVQQYFFVNNNPQGDLITDRTLILCYAPRETADPGDEWHWSVVRAGTSLAIPSDGFAAICVYNSGKLVNIEGFFQSHLAFLADSQEMVQQMDEQHGLIEVYEFPESLRGQSIPQGSQWREEELKQLKLSFADFEAARQQASHNSIFEKLKFWE